MVHLRFSNGDLILEELIGWHFHESMRMEDRVVRMRRVRRERESSPQAGSMLQPSGHKRKRLEDSDAEPQMVSRAAFVRMARMMSRLGPHRS